MPIECRSTDWWFWPVTLLVRSLGNWGLVGEGCPYEDCQGLRRTSWYIARGCRQAQLVAGSHKAVRY